MDYIAVIGIAVGLAMDAFAVSVTNGAIVKNFKPSFAIKIATAFGIFQFMMPVIGWIVGKAGQQLIESVDHYIAFILLLLIGGNMLIEAIKDRIKEYKGEEVQKKDNKTATSTKTLLLMAAATSIDALATGVILPSAVGASTIMLMLVAVLMIGVITFIISFAGVYLGKKFGSLLSNKAEILGGIVLIGIGTKILIEHLFFM